MTDIKDIFENILLIIVCVNTPCEEIDVVCKLIYLYSSFSRYH